MTGLGGRAGGMRHGKPAGLWGGQGRGAAAGQGGQPEAGFRPSVGVPLRAPLAPLSLLSMTHVRWGWLDAATLWGRGLTLAPRLPGPMALRRLCLTLLACSGCWAQEVRVSQPGSVRAPEGGSVTLPCRYNSSRPAALGSYRWVKEEAGARLETPPHSPRTPRHWAPSACGWAPLWGSLSELPSCFGSAASGEKTGETHDPGRKPWCRPRARS
ncbi:natural cytotoxicity triggering receptor 3 isoform X6 [Pelodiscus sinensis]|uniref:natural cytotoxicity triggering receptor 3 isoform X6 n=1 Tax=Pelodiscus sinensis TaxID=13735 RepID=UPI003F6BC78B